MPSATAYSRLLLIQSGTGSEGISNSLTNMYYLQKSPILSEEFVRGLPIPPLQIC